MTAIVIPFPRSRNMRFVRRHAARMADFRQIGAERYLANQIRIQREALERRGVARDWIAEEVAATEEAIRAEHDSYSRRHVR